MAILPDIVVILKTFSGFSSVFQSPIAEDGPQAGGQGKI